MKFPFVELPAWALPVWFVVALASFFITYLPAIIGRNKRNCRAILALNFFGGWTGIGWIVALVWACTEDSEEDRAQARPLSVSSLFAVHFILTVATGLVLVVLTNSALKAADKLAQEERDRASIAEREHQVRMRDIEGSYGSDPKPSVSAAPVEMPVPLTAEQLAQQQAERRAYYERLTMERKQGQASRDVWEDYYRDKRPR